MVGVGGGDGIPPPEPGCYFGGTGCRLFWTARQWIYPQQDFVPLPPALLPVWAVHSGQPLMLSGAIGQKWWELVERGRVGGFFPGYPTTDEDGTPSAVRWTHFENGSIYWLSHTGAPETHGAIRDLWSNQLHPSGPDSWLGGPR